MAWIKRNLYFVITVVLGLGVTGYCGYLLYTAMASNAKASDDYAAAKSSLNDLQNKKPFPDTANIQAAEADAERVRTFLEEFRKPFSGFPVPPKVDDRQFKEYLQKSIAGFGAEATNAGVGLTAGYAFAFSQQMDKLNYPPEAIAPWMQELEEMKAILRILYAAKINFLEKIKRPSVSSDDVGGDDYTQFGVVTNQYGVVTPYRLEFRAFSGEIANVLAGIAASSNCFIVQSLYVEKSLVPLPDLPLTPVAQAPPPVQYYRPPPPAFDTFGGPPPGSGRDPSDRRSMRRMQPQPAPVYTPATPSGPTGPTGPVTILREKPLFVTLYLEVIKLKPSEAPALKPRTAERTQR